MLDQLLAAPCIVTRESGFCIDSLQLLASLRRYVFFAHSMKSLAVRAPQSLSETSRWNPDPGSVAAAGLLGCVVARGWFDSKTNVLFSIVFGIVACLSIKWLFNSSGC